MSPLEPSDQESQGVGILPRETTMNISAPTLA